jgi:hypothetical protein
MYVSTSVNITVYSLAQLLGANKLKKKEREEDKGASYWQAVSYC